MYLLVHTKQKAYAKFCIKMCLVGMSMSHTTDNGIAFNSIQPVAGGKTLSYSCHKGG